MLTPHRHYCTYFDHRYLARGLALHASLVATGDRFTLWVLALSPQVQQFFAANPCPGIRVLALSELETFDADLLATKETRSLVEYYFTCSPCLPHYLLSTQPDVDAVTYLDSDLYFFSSPESVFHEIDAAPVAVTPHRFTAASEGSHGRFGRYNVGWLTFRNDPVGLDCLRWWRARCLEWCCDRVEADRYADQKYLDRFQSLFPGVHAIRHPGANLAPWNIGDARIRLHQGHVEVNGQALVFFHFQGLRAISGHVYDSNLGSYGAHLTATARTGIFKPYITELKAADARVRRAGIEVAPHVRRPETPLGRARQAIGSGLRVARSAVLGNLVAS